MYLLALRENLLEMKVDGTKYSKVHADENKGKNGGHTPSGLGGRSIVVVR